MTTDDRPPGLPDAVLAILRQPDMLADPPADLQARTWAAIREDSARAAGETTETAEDVDRTTEGVDELASARHRRSARRRWVPLLAAAAAAAIVGTVTVVAVTGDDDPAATTVALAGTDVEPGAEGQAEITSTPSGFEIQLDISGLPPSPEGTYYQGWLRNDSDAVTIGTFHGREGSDDIILWSGVDVADFPTLTVTIQQVGGGAESSGVVVLRGEIDAD